MKNAGTYKPKGYTPQAIKDAKIRLAFRKRKVSSIKVYHNKSLEEGDQ